MEFNLASAKLTGNPGTSGWAQVYDFKPEDPEKLKARGHIFVVVATKKEGQAVDGITSGREIISRFQEEYYGNLEGTPFNTLKSALSKVVSEFAFSLGNIEIAAVALLDNVVYVASGGGARVSILRNGIFANILESEAGSVVAASGYPKAGDTLLLGSKIFFEIFPNGVIKAALESTNVESSIESFAPVAHTKENTGSLGVIVLKFDEALEIAPIKKEEESLSAKIPGFFEIIKSKIRFPQLPLPERKIYIRRQAGEFEGEEPQGKRVMVLVGGILLVLLIVSMGFGIRQKKIKEEKSHYEPKLTTAEHELDEATDLFSLNPDRARELFSDSLSISLGLKNQGIKDPRLVALVEKLNQNEGKILGEYRVSSQDFLDLSLQTSGFVGDDMATSGEKMYILDKNGKKIVRVVIDSKKTAVFAGPEQVTSALAIAAYEDRAFILTDSGIYEVGSKKIKVIEKDWAGEVLPYSYAGNFYVLDKTGSTIWRYAGSGESFGSRQRWLGAGILPNFSSAISVTIDGAIWVLTKAGGIQKFSLGVPQKLSALAINPNLTFASAIYTNEELKFVYILDSQDKRVIVLDKDGNYKAQYVDDKLGQAKDLAASEKDKKIIFLAGSKLYLIEMKHL